MQITRCSLLPYIIRFESAGIKHACNENARASRDLSTELFRDLVYAAHRGLASRRPLTRLPPLECIQS